MFRIAVIHSDEVADIGRAATALDKTGRAGNGSLYLRNLLDRMSQMSNDDTLRLTHEERVSLYVASKVLIRAN